MPDALHDHIQAVARNRDLSGYNEDQTKQAILLPILQMLGWPIFSASEVYPEYSAGRGRVDYALRVGNANKVFVEAKRCSVDLEAHQEHLLRYAFQHGVSLAVLTNG
ncbi:MAG: restriction endonuclease subunit R, partial [Bacteroidota bacterium]